MKKSKSVYNNLEIVYVPAGWVDQEKEAARIKDYEDLESGRISPGELNQKNCINWGADIKVKIKSSGDFGWN